VFSAFVSNSDQEASAQGVIPSQFGADQVHLPDAIAGRTLVRNLEHTSAFSPNGDGVNDEYELGLTVVKTDREPTVRLFDLAGRLVVELQNQSLETRRGQYVWDGRREGQMMPPGVYVLQIEVDSDARTERVHKTVSLVY
jgi:gliding motility-associated-like protein